MDLGMQNYIDNHFLSQGLEGPASHTTGIEHDYDGKRTYKDVRDELILGHKILGTNFDEFATLHPKEKERRHTTAEFYGHDALKHKYLDAQHKDRGN